VAEPGSRDANEHFAAAGCVELELFDPKRATFGIWPGRPHLAQNCCLDLHVRAVSAATDWLLDTLMAGKGEHMEQRRASRDEYRHFTTLTTRWSDNDAYRHLNNVVYYSLFDTAVNEALIRAGLLDVERSPSIGLVVETGCRYFEPLAFPDVVEAGIRVTSLGRSSVRYEIGLFQQGSDTPAAQGHFVHVYVSRGTGRPVDMSSDTRSFLEGLSV
jgi:acyl-CoA thioester hydrolase